MWFSWLFVDDDDDDDELRLHLLHIEFSFLFWSKTCQIDVWRVIRFIFFFCIKCKYQSDILRKKCSILFFFVCSKKEKKTLLEPDFVTVYTHTHGHKNLIQILTWLNPFCLIDWLFIRFDWCYRLLSSNWIVIKFFSNFFVAAIYKNFFWWMKSN